MITDDTKKILSKYDQTGYASDHLPNYTGAYSGADVMPLIRIPEMYYIMAECDPDPQSSAEILDMVRFKRGIASSDATDGGKGYDEPDTREGFDSGHTRRINEVMREYLKEYYVKENTCNCLRGQLMLPNTPVLQGFGSYSGCNCTAPSPPTQEGISLRSGSPWLTLLADSHEKNALFTSI